MKHKFHLKQFIHSLLIKQFILMTALILPVVILAIITIQHSQRTLIQHIEDTHYHMLSSYVTQIDNQLYQANTYLVNLVTYENDPQIIANSSDNAAIQYAKKRLYNNLSQQILTTSSLDGYFLYIPETDGTVSFFHINNWQPLLGDNSILKSYIASVNSSGLINGFWDTVSFDGTEYLMLSVKGNDNIIAGAYVQATSLINEFESADSTLQILSSPYVPANTNDTLTICCESSYGNYVIIETLSRDEIMQTLPFVQRNSTYVILFILIVVVSFFWFSYHSTVKPILELTAAMKHIGEGDLTYQIPEKRSSYEIMLLNSSFNQMIREIRQLKINFYEEKASAQKAQLRALQLQVRPHFLINSLNMVYNFIQTNDTKTASNLIQYTVHFFRYMVNVDKDLIPLKYELEHIQAYLNIQAIRYEDMIVYHSDIDPMIVNMLIPPVTIQGLIENSLKYALSAGHILNLNIVVSCFEKNDYPYAKIVVSDNGSGFPSDLLSALNSGEKIISDGVAHIGISNTIQRLKLLFKSDINWKFYNDGGAVCEIIIPALFPQDEELLY